MNRSETYKAIAQRLGPVIADKETFSQFSVGDWVTVVYDGHIEGYGAITRIIGSKAVVASAEGNITAPISNLKLVRKAR